MKTQQRSRKRTISTKIIRVYRCTAYLNGRVIRTIKGLGFLEFGVLIQASLEIIFGTLSYITRTKIHCATIKLGCLALGRKYLYPTRDNSLALSRLL